MQKLLTIVVPSYNMEHYLERCLKSLILPAEQMNLFEVLVINDGSKDGTSKIGHYFQELHPNTYRIIDKENGNYGSCINRGLKEAKGKYIKVLDADDWFDTKDFGSYLKNLNVIDADMIITDYQIVDNDEHLSKKVSFPIAYNETFDFQQYTNAEVFFSMHSLTYRTDTLRKINYKQTEGISYTDTEWVFYPQHGVNTCIYLDYDIYRYVIGRDGQTMDSSVLLRSVDHYYKLLRVMVNFGNQLSEQDKHKFTYKQLEAQITHLSMGVYRTCLVLQSADSWNEELLCSFDSFIKKERPLVYREAASLKLKKYIPVPYVRYWRATGRRFSVDFVRDTYRLIRYGRK